MEVLVPVCSTSWWSTAACFFTGWLWQRRPLPGHRVFSSSYHTRWSYLGASWTCLCNKVAALQLSLNLPSVLHIRWLLVVCCLPCVWHVLSTLADMWWPFSQHSAFLSFPVLQNLTHCLSTRWMFISWWRCLCCILSNLLMWRLYRVQVSELYRNVGIMMAL